MPPRSRTWSEQDVGTVLLLAAVFGVAGVAALLWAGGVTARLLSGRGVPHASTLSGLRTLAHPGDPARGWRTPMPGPVEYWSVTALLLMAVGLVVVLALRWFSSQNGGSWAADRP